MKKLFFLLIFTLQSGLSMAAWDYTGPDDERIPYGRRAVESTLGLVARRMHVGAVADVIEDVTEPKKRDLSSGYFKVRVVTPIYGCTNGQEIVLGKYDPQEAEGYWHYDPNYEYNPTNNSRIVFFVHDFKPSTPYSWTPKVWKQPPEPETIMSATGKPVLQHWTRQWWYDGEYQDNLPYTHLTNLLHAARVERNWTNYYHIIRDAIPTPASPRVWQDSFYDISDMLRYASEAQFEYMMNDPLFPAEMQERLQDFYERRRRYGEDE